MKLQLPSLVEARKTIVALLGVAATLLAAGLLPANVAHYVSAVLAFATAAGVYATPNGVRKPVDTGPGSTVDETPAP